MTFDSSASSARLGGIFPELLRDKLVVVVTSTDSTTIHALASYQCRGVLALMPANSNGIDEPWPGLITQTLERAKQIYANNCQIALLDCLQAALFSKKYKFRRLEYIACRINMGLLLATPLLAFHALTGKVSFSGFATIESPVGTPRYLVFRNRQKNKDRRRQYLPADRSVLEGLASLSDLTLVTLRNHDAIREGTHTHDVDALVTASDVSRVVERLGKHIGTRPLDVYTDDGTQGFNLNGAAYYAPLVAKRIVGASALETCGMRSPDKTWRYLSYAYHLIFHGKLKVAALTRTLTPAVFVSDHNHTELLRLADAAGRRLPERADDLIAELADAGAMPSLDLIWFYAKHDDFLKAWLSRRPVPPPGLATFFIRDFGQPGDAARTVRQRLSERFQILHDATLSGASQLSAISTVRGGNWSDRYATDGFAPPVHWFIVWDADVKTPGWITHRKWPNMDNRRVLIKESLRRELSGNGGRSFRIVHSSDNSSEAISHVCSIDFEQRRAVIDKLLALGMPQECFETWGPVIG